MAPWPPIRRSGRSRRRRWWCRRGRCRPRCRRGACRAGPRWTPGWSGSRRTTGPVAPGPPWNRVSPLNTALEFGGVPAHRAGGVARGVQRAQLDAADAQRLAVLDGAEIAVRVGHSPQHVVGGVQQHRRVEGLAELGGDGDVVVVAVGADHRDDVAAADGLDDRVPRCGRRRTPRRRSRRRRSRCCCRRPSCRRRVRTCRG